MSVAASACGDVSETPPPDPLPLGGARPVSYFATPDDWDGKTPLPLVVVTHGYGVGGLAQVIFFDLQPLVNEKKIMLVAPDGLFDSAGSRYWNAVDTCCDFDHRGNDDVAYLTGLVAEIAAKYPTDPKRVYVVGHSNGAAMAMRLACDESGTFAAVFELAGPFWSQPESQCHPTHPVAIRVLHGTADTEVPYDGGAIGDVDNLYSPGAQAVASFWAEKNGCNPAPDTSAPNMDLEMGIAGAETTVTRWGGCAPDGDVELWSMQGAGHIPYLTPDFHEIVWNFFAAHSR